MQRPRRSAGQRNGVFGSDGVCGRVGTLEEDAVWREEGGGAVCRECVMGGGGSPARSLPGFSHTEITEPTEGGGAGGFFVCLIC